MSARRWPHRGEPTLQNPYPAIEYIGDFGNASLKLLQTTEGISHKGKLYYLKGLCLGKFVHTNLPQAGFELGTLGPQAGVIPIEPPLIVG